MPKYSLFGKKEQQEASAQGDSPVVQTPAQAGPVLVIPRDDTTAPQPQPPLPQQSVEPIAPMLPQPASLPPPQQRVREEYDTLLAWVSKLSVDQIRKYFTPEGIRELLRQLATDENNAVAKLALALCDSLKQ